MSDREGLEAQQEAKSSSPTTTSADRARLWAGMNRYLASELHHAKRRVKDERSADDSASRSS